MERIKVLPTPRLSNSSIQLFEQWTKFLSITNDKPGNRQILFNYFFDKFASSPQSFYLFLEYFKNNLGDSRHSAGRKNLAKKYLEILSPLCERFNFYEEKNLLDDLCFKTLKPKKYEEIKNIYSRYAEGAKKIIEKVLKTINDTLKGRGYEFELIGRCKNIYSIYKKINKQGVDVLKVNDIFACRVILENGQPGQCFEVANILHDKFQPVPDLFKDYISIPKINGYQTLHTGLTKVIDELDLPIEVQIRTRAMHNFAENGLAAHWLYAQDKKAQLITEKEKRLLDYFSCIAHSSKKENLLYCFTCDGDIVELDKKSTVLDFAYKIHSDLGNRISYALVNGEEKPVYYRIKEGDRIEIVPAKDIQIEKKWLNYAYSKNAYKKIQDYLKTI